MRSHFIAISLALLVSSSFGCSDDDCTPCSPRPKKETGLAIMSHQTSGGGAEIFDSIKLSVYYSGGQIRLPDVGLAGGCEGYKVVFDTTTAGVKDFFENVTNGIDEVIAMKFIFPTGSSTRGDYESGWFEGGATGELSPDLIGTEVTKAVVHLDNVVINTPGSDPNHDGIWTDYNVSVRLEFLGYLDD